MSPVAINYRPMPIIFGTLAFGVAGVWIAFGPQTSGPVGRVLGAGNSLSLIATAAAAAAIACTSVFLAYLTRLAVGLPAIEVKRDSLSINFFPFRNYKLGAIRSVDYDEKWLTINLSGRGKRRVNAKLLANYDKEAAQLVRIVNGRAAGIRR